MTGLIQLLEREDELATFDRALLLGMLGGSATATLAVSGTVPGSVHFRGTASVEVAGPCATMAEPRGQTPSRAEGARPLSASSTLRNSAAR